jgi:hypothetical protein
MERSSGREKKGLRAIEEHVEQARSEAEEESDKNF